MFQDLSFTDIFNTFDDEYLTHIAETHPDQLRRMCMFLSLDAQLLYEKHHIKGKKDKIEIN